ncbi:hypothetical protein GCM10027277_33210 [Pseudoduganella ginsengisoli]
MPANSVTITGFDAHGPTGTASALGGVAGLLPGAVTLRDDTDFFSEASLVIPALSPILAFDLVTTDNHSPGGSPDSLSLHLLDINALAPLFSTSDPTGSDALFVLALDGSGFGGLSVYSALGGEVIVSAESLQQSVPEPGTFALVILGLAMLALRRRMPMILALALYATGTAQAAERLDASFTFAKGPVVYNRVTDTFDTTVTLTNRGGEPVTGPLQLAVRDIATPGATVYNAATVDSEANAWVDVPLDTGIVPPGASATAVVKFIDPQRLPITYGLSVRGTVLLPSARGQLRVRPVNGEGRETRPAGPGVEVLVNGVPRGKTGPDGTLTVLCASGTADVIARLAPTAVGVATLEVPVGDLANVDVILDSDKEVYSPAQLRIDQVQQRLLDASFATWSMRFMLPGERTALLRDLAGADLYDRTGKRLLSLQSLLKLDQDGVVRPTNPEALRKVLSSLPGGVELEVRGADSMGTAFYGRQSFHMGRYHVSGRLTAPASVPGLPLGGVRVIATVLNTDIVLSTVTASDGSFVLPALPGGNLRLEARTLQGGHTYRGAGVFTVVKDLSITLPLLSPNDPISKSTPAATGTIMAKAAATGNAREDATTTEQRRERQAQSAGRQRQQLLSKNVTTSAANEVAVNVTAGAEGAAILDSATLTVPKGTKQVTLTYIVSSREYPDYVTAQSKFNDIWGVTVRADADGSILFDQTMQVNSQLETPPVWQADGTTGELTRSFDVTQLAKEDSTKLTLSAFATNIGDEILPTSVYAKLAPSAHIDINAVSPAPDAWVSHNNGSYYSVPPTGQNSTFQRRFNLDVVKPDDVTVENVKVEMLGAGDDALVLDEAVGMDANWVDDHTLRVIGTFKSHASTVTAAPPPTSATRYRFTLKAKDGEGNTLDASKTDVDKHPLWRMPSSLPRFGGRDAGGDDWCSKGAYEWMQENAAMLEPVNDVSGEHGKDLGHASHAKGTDIDMYHFYLFAGANADSGTSNYEKLVQRLLDLPKLTSTNAATRAQGQAAKAEIQSWIAATRAGIDKLAALGSVTQVGYIRSGPGSGAISGADWGAVLLRTGTVTVNGSPFDLEVGTWDNSKYFPWPNHHHHVHVTLNLAD